MYVCMCPARGSERQGQRLQAAGRRRNSHREGQSSATRHPTEGSGILTYTFSYIHTYTHLFIHTHLHIHLYIHKHTYFLIYTHTYIHFSYNM